VRGAGTRASFAKLSAVLVFFPLKSELVPLRPRRAELECVGLTKPAPTTLDLAYLRTLGTWRQYSTVAVWVNLEREGIL
jgi:hypothetical protein